MTRTDGADSGFGQADGAYATLYRDLVEAVLRRRGARGWSVAPGEFWCGVRPTGAPQREQGWKLHVSATPLSAPMVLAGAAEVLVAQRAAFKFAGTPDRLAELVSGRADRGSGGKFITVYPQDDDAFRRLAEALHRATEHLPGPGILSDRPYRPGSLVHYRYGAFTGHPRLTNDGAVETMLRAPDGSAVRDRRLAWFSPPAWAVDPLPVAASPAAAPSAVLLNDRYEVRRALRHAYKGGVYVGTDRAGGAEVVIKEARRHVGATRYGTDAGDLLRHEADMLAALAHTGLSPRPVDRFRQGGNQYLVQELVPGQTLRSWAEARHAPESALLLGLADQLVALLGTVHELGFVVRDLTPNNLMVTPDEQLRLIDLEMLARPGEPVLRAHTPGFAGPEVTGAAPYGPAPEATSDLYSLGAVLLHLLTGTSPLFVPDRPADRGPDDRLAALVTGALSARPELRPFEPVLLGLTRADPGERWTLARTREQLGRIRAGAAGPTGARPAPALTVRDGERLLTDGLAFLLATMTPEDEDRLWPADRHGAQTDPRNVQHGAAGVLAVLAAAATHRADAALHEAVGWAAEWLVTRARDHQPHLPGLYFGSSGTAWALLEAARVLEDGPLAQAAAELALAVPVRHPQPDVCHGVAGAGLAQLHFWHATGRAEFRDRAAAAAEHLLTVGVQGRSGVLWPVPADFDSELAGIHHLGFGHGVAGVGTFLLLAGLATGREEFVAAARAAGETLLTAARVEDGAAHWAPDDRRADAPSAGPHWCSGSSGVGTFLIRLWQTTGDPRHRLAAEQAAVAVHRARWRGTPVACHGLAGNAEFLLDLAEALDMPGYWQWAEELVGCALTRTVHRDGLVLTPDESMLAVSAAYNTGTAGLLGLLLRMRHGGTRMWLPDPATVPAAEPRG
ncbi:class IV lanthionine synthetase LanL [Kitasatospora sp. NPDC058965]|uniref:class IV lanthionine synthetase LanL n=1 Tax=Kitasatospora sp. NPDC058965 TaxID=3346682 RepID=UPI0036ABA638